MNYVAEINIGRDIQIDGYRSILAELLAALNDQECAGVILLVDSNGGEVCAHVMEIADAIFTATKPIFAYALEALSAGYWIASQARGGISASRGASIGSIGVIGVILDRSEAAAREGIKVHVIRTQPNKSQGMDGEVIDQKFLDEFAQEANQVDAMFRADIARARPGVDLTAQRGETYMANKALTLGLIDRVETYAEFSQRVLGPEGK